MIKNKIVIFGINGWVGKALLDFLHNQLKIPSDDLVLISSSSAEVSLINGTKFTCISYEEALNLPYNNVMFLHLAFKLKDKLSTTTIEEYQKQNHVIRDKAKKLIKHFKPAKMVYTSSGAVYDENYDLCKSLKKNPYGYLKIQDEEFFSRLAKTYNFKILIPRIFNIAGHYINKYNLYAISDFILQAAHTNKIIINANFPVIRSYIEIYDLIEIITKWITDNKSNNFIFDTANTNNLELSDLAELTINTLNLQANIIRKEIDPNLKSNSYIGNTKNLNILLNKYDIKLKSHSTCIKHVYDYLKLKQEI